VRTGALMDEIGDSGDNKDSEDLFFDAEEISSIKSTIAHFYGLLKIVFLNLIT
jgi:hypothetical protein